MEKFPQFEGIYISYSFIVGNDGLITFYKVKIFFNNLLYRLTNNKYIGFLNFPKSIWMTTLSGTDTKAYNAKVAYRQQGPCFHHACFVDTVSPESIAGKPANRENSVLHKCCKSPCYRAIYHTFLTLNFQTNSFTL